jgi:hypothetical protein
MKMWSVYTIKYKIYVLFKDELPIIEYQFGYYDEACEHMKQEFLKVNQEKNDNIDTFTSEINGNIA